MAGNIIYFRYYKNVEIDVDDVYDSFSVHKELGTGPEVKRIVHMELFGTITRAARDLVQNEGMPATAEAFILPSIAQKIMFNLYAKMRKQRHPIKAFKRLDEAIEWFEDFE